MTLINDQLTAIGELMAQDPDALTRSIGEEIIDTAARHTIWADYCDGSTSHVYNDVPCDEFERAINLALIWARDHCELVRKN